MNDAPVTALMPVKAYHPIYLRRALDSMFRQTSPAWRLGVVVDEQPNGELRKVLGPALRDERVQLVLNEGSGLAGAINTGMRHATSTFTAILLGDDLWSPDAVSVLTRRIAEAPGADFLHSARVVVDENDRPISPVYPARERFTLDDFAYGSPVKHLLCWRRSAALDIGGLDEESASVGPDDYDFPWRMAEAGFTFEPVPECLYLYRDHRDCFRLTTHLPLTTHTRELRRIFRKHGLDRVETEVAIKRARDNYLQQCLYRTRFDRWMKERLGHDPRSGWRMQYE